MKHKLWIFFLEDHNVGKITFEIINSAAKSWTEHVQDIEKGIHRFIGKYSS